MYSKLYDTTVAECLIKIEKYEELQDHTTSKTLQNEAGLYIDLYSDMILAIETIRENHTTIARS